jgi:hypothetical protein
MGQETSRMSTDPGTLDAIHASHTPSPVNGPAGHADGDGASREWRERTGFLHLPLSRVQMFVGLTAGMLSITGALFPVVRMLHREVGHGDVVASVREARSDAPVRDALVEILTADDAVLTTMKIGPGGTARDTVREGSYRIQVSHPRFGTERRQIHVMAGQVAEIRFRLAPRAPLAPAAAAAPAIEAVKPAAPPRPVAKSLREKPAVRQPGAISAAPGIVRRAAESP